MTVRGLTTALGATAAWTLGRFTGTPRRASTIGLLALVGTQLGQTLTLAGPVGHADGVRQRRAARRGGADTPVISSLFGCRPIGPLGWTTALTCAGADRPGRQHDQTAMRTEGIVEQLRLHPQVRAAIDEGYRGLANEFPDLVSAPPRKPKDDVPEGEKRAWREMRRRQSSRRICVEHANAEHKQWRPLQR